MQWSAVFTSAVTYEQYLKHFRFVHKFLGMPNTWYTQSVVQVRKGLARVDRSVPKKIALTSQVVRQMIRIVKNDDMELAGLMAIARMFLLRVPSEALPLEWDGQRSSIQLTQTTAVITLAKRKNRSSPSTLTRSCCCSTSGVALCAVHWLRKLAAKKKEGSKVFGLQVHKVRRHVKNAAKEAGVTDWEHVGTHGLRRGMAQDILDAGSPLTVLLRAGGWSSAAFLEYLRADQCQDAAAGQAVIYLSDSDGDAC